MNLYNDQDKDNLLKKIEEIQEKAESIANAKIEPTIDKMWDIIYTVRDFVIEKKRKIYGGFALNLLIEDVAPQDKFYDEDNVKKWDIDFYSPTPIEDAREIANRLHKKGYKHIIANEAQHDETYKVFAETLDCADITYVPKNIYHKIPIKDIKGMRITGVYFMMIDYFRVLTDPLTSWFRLDKTFDRLVLMLKHYPLPSITDSINIEPPELDLDVAFNVVHKFLIDRESCITVGMYALNHLVKESKIYERIKKNKKSNLTKIDITYINYYEIITTQYKTDTRDLILKLYETFPEQKNRITYEENYPFFQYFGYNVNIKFDDEIICRVYHYNTRCIPYKDVPALYFKNSDYIKHKGNIRIGTYALQILYNLINVMKARTDGNHNDKHLYFTIISHMIETRNYFFEQNKKDIFSDSLFQEFITKCIGDMLRPQVEKAKRIERRRKAGKRYTWSYNPDNENDRNNNSNYFFKNSSGNFIRNEKNRKIDLTNNIVSEDNILSDEEN